MTINLKNFLNPMNKLSKMRDFQDLDHLEGLSISAISADLYENMIRDDLTLFYFNKGAKYASLYTKNKIVSENIKYNQKIKNRFVKALLINTKNANCFNDNGFEGLRQLAKYLSKELTLKSSRNDIGVEDTIKPNEILFACTGDIGESYPTEKIKKQIPYLVEKLKAVQNKHIWVKAANAIMTTDLKPKLACEECKIGQKDIKIYGIAKGSGMIAPNMGTMLSFIFTDADISNSILKELLKNNISTTFNAITVDSDTSTNDMVSIFSTGSANNQKIYNHLDPKLINFNKSLHKVMLNLAKQIVKDGEGAKKFLIINITKAKNNKIAKHIAFSIANSPLVKTAIAGEDPNWGRIIMAIGKSKEDIMIKKLNIKIGEFSVIENGKLIPDYNESNIKEYMEWDTCEINIELNMGEGNFTAYTCDFTKDYIDINTDYRN